MSESGNKSKPDTKETVSPQEETTSLTVGQILKQEREARGLNLTTVSKELMIRKFYLGALEEGRYVELPDTVYATGFVKSYAEMMGLEEGPLVAQFKRERGEASRPELSFPDPLQESKMPSKPVIMGGIAAAAAILFLWAHIAGEDTSNALETVPEPPEEVLSERVASVPVPPDTSSALVDDSSVANVPVAPEVDILNPDENIEVSQNIPQPQAELESSPQADMPAPPEEREENAVVIKPTMPQATATPQAQATPRVSRDENVIAVPPPPTPKVEAQPEQPRMDDERAADRVVVTSGETTPELINPDSNRNSRVTVAASQETWVEIRDRNGRLLLTRVLQPGQHYDVPDEKGITMITGNAGGVYLVVDGKKMPPLGKPASVKRNIRLDADLY